jgi:hypothetical protein
MHRPKTQQIEGLDRLFICQDCRAVFLFSSDVEDHKRIFQHEDMKIRPLY